MALKRMVGSFTAPTFLYYQTMVGFATAKPTLRFKAIKLRNYLIVLYFF